MAECEKYCQKNKQSDVIGSSLAEVGGPSQEGDISTEI